MLDEARRRLASGGARAALALLRRLRHAQPADLEVQLACAEAAAAAGQRALARAALRDAVALWRPPAGPDPLRFLAVVEAGTPLLAWHVDPVDWRIGQGLLAAWRLDPGRAPLAAGLGRFLSYLEGEPHGLQGAPSAFQVLDGVVTAAGAPGGGEACGAPGGSEACGAPGGGEACGAPGGGVAGGDPRTRWRWLLGCLQELDVALCEWPRGLQPSEVLPAGAGRGAALAAVRRALAVGRELRDRLGEPRELREVLRRLRAYEVELLTLAPAPDRGSPAF